MKWAAGLVMGLAVSACGDSAESFRVSGSVRGLWDGSDGVVLRLTAEGVDTLLTVPGNGAFELPPMLADHESYTLAIENQPFAHTCLIVDGDLRTSEVIKAYAVPFEIVCAGPAVAVAASAGRDVWQLDPTRDSQTFNGSIFDSDLHIGLSSGVPLASLTIDGEPIDGDSVFFSRTFPVGPLSLAVRFVTRSGLSKTYTLTFDRGGAPAGQTAYGKAPAGADSHAVGAALAIDGDTLVVAASPAQTHAATIFDKPGAVTVFVRNPDDGSWQQQAELTSPADGVQDLFGYAVAIAGGTIVVGAPGARGGAGAAYVYTRDLVGNWSLTDTLVDPLGVISELGSSVAMESNEIVVGAPFDDSDPTASGHAVANGAVHVFRWAGGWQHALTLKPLLDRRGLTFGASVALSDDTLVVGAPSFAVTGTEPVDAQSVYVFRGRDDRWREEARLVTPRADLYFGFGLAVAVSGDTLAIGAPFETGTNRGIDAPEVLSDQLASGAVYTYTRSAGTWSREAYIKSSSAMYGDEFGASVALHGDVLAVGAPGESRPRPDDTHLDSDAQRSGAALLFGRSAAGWRQVGYHKASNAGADDQLGFSVALSDQRLVVGAPLEDGASAGVSDRPQAGDGGPDTGAFYIFE